MKLCESTPVLRMLDIDKAREFYCDFLGFKVDFEHRFGDNFPLYMGISRDGCGLHLSEHHGDASPGAYVRIRTEDVQALFEELRDKDYKYAKPGVEETEWNTRQVTVTDPFMNKLQFYELIEA